MSVSLDQARWLRLAEITALSASDLTELQSAAAESFNQAKLLKDAINGAIALKYRDQAKSIRLQQGKDTGIVHFDDDGIRVTADLPKKPVWDQTELSEIAERIAAQGDDPSEYLEITLKVSERKYSAWPEHIRKQFAPARTLTTGRSTFKLAEAVVDSEGAE